MLNLLSRVDQTNYNNFNKEMKFSTISEIVNFVKIFIADRVVEISTWLGMHKDNLKMSAITLSIAY